MPELDLRGWLELMSKCPKCDGTSRGWFENDKCIINCSHCGIFSIPKKELEERARKADERAHSKVELSSGSDSEGDDDDRGRSSNDDRSDSMNPNNDAHDAANDNHSNQCNPNNDEYHHSHGHK